MTGELVLSSRTVVERYDVDHGDDQHDWLLRVLDEKLVVIAPNEEIWHAYAKEVGYAYQTNHHRTSVVKHGSQLVEMRMIAPMVLVVKLPYDLDFRLEMIGALTEMQPSWEAQGGRVIYVDNWQPPASLELSAAREQKAARNRISRAEYAAAQTEMWRG